MSRPTDRVRVVKREANDARCSNCGAWVSEAVRFCDPDGLFIVDRCTYCGETVPDPLPGEVEREWEQNQIDL